MSDPMINMKKKAAERAVEYIKDGMWVGLGTGSTAIWAIHAIANKVKEGMQVKAIATSGHSELLALESGIPIFTFADTGYLDITIDGADEVDENMNLIKGGGGALLREKIVGSATKFYIIIADEKKQVKTLGTFPLPVEVVQFGYQHTVKLLEKLGCTTSIRKKEGNPFITDNGNYIFDCSFGAITNPESLHPDINSIPGVVENGLFVGMADVVIIGRSDGEAEVISRESGIQSLATNF